MHPTHLPQVWETHKHFRKTQKCCCFFFCFLHWLRVRLHAFQHISTTTGGDSNYSSLLSQRLSQSGKLDGALGGPVGWPTIFQGCLPGGCHCIRDVCIMNRTFWILSVSQTRRHIWLRELLIAICHYLLCFYRLTNESVKPNKALLYCTRPKLWILTQLFIFSNGSNFSSSHCILLDFTLRTWPIKRKATIRGWLCCCAIGLI